MTSLVIQTAYLGDVILTTPLLQAVADRDGAPIDVVTTPRAAPLIDTLPAVRQVHPFDKRRTDRGPGGVLRMGRMLRAQGYDMAYLPHRSLRSAALARLARIPNRIGFAGAPGRWLYTARVGWDATRHESDRLLSLAGADARRYQPSITLTIDDHNAATAWLRARGLDGRTFVALAPGSVWTTKRWPYYRGLAERLAPTIPVVLVGGADERALVAGWETKGVASAVGELSIRAGAALIQRAEALITNDSAPLHIAGAVGTPVIALFGPTVATAGFGPRGPLDRVLGVSGLGCRPCSTHGGARCPLDHHRCMRDLSPEQVLHAFEEVHALRHGR